MFQKECFTEGRSRAIGIQRVRLVAHDRLLGHQEQNLEIRRIRKFWVA